MAKFSKLNGSLDRALARMDELGDEQLQAMRNTPEAKAAQAANRAKIEAAERRAEQRRVQARAEAADVACGFSVGQSVRTRRGEVLEVAAIDDRTVTMTNGQRYAATMLVAA